MTIFILEDHSDRQVGSGTGQRHRAGDHRAGLLRDYRIIPDQFESGHFGMIVVMVFFATREREQED